MTNWRQILSWRQTPEGFEEGNPPYSEDADFDVDGIPHVYRISYSESVFGHFDIEARCKREARERYESGLENPDTEIDEYDNFEPYFREMRDKGRVNGDREF